MKTLLAFDPGDSTGWVHVGFDGEIIAAGTIVKDFLCVYNLIESAHPSVVLYESFNLYPGAAKSLSWNSFYPCEVIGVIKFICELRNIECVRQTPGDKKFSGGLDERLLNFRDRTEHTKDAYLHAKFYLRKNKIVSYSK